MTRLAGTQKEGGMEGDNCRTGLGKGLNIKQVLAPS